MDPSASDLLRSVLEQAGAVALERFRDVAPERKADGSVVTEADRAAEEVLVDRLSRAFPDDAIRGEEGARVAGRAGGGTWYVDPIDGTGTFVAQLAYWGPTCCRVDASGALEVGAFYVPRLRELWFALRGGGAWRDGARLTPPPLAEVAGDTLLMAPSRFHRHGAVPWPGKVRALGSSAAHLALVAAGSAAATVVPRWSLWDVGCGTLLIREAGRVIWDLAGDPVAPERCDPGLPMLAGAPIALRLLSAGLRPAARES